MRCAWRSSPIRAEAGRDIDEAKAEAEYNDGVLKLTLPKKAGAETKKLAIK